jgi:hypothetical protein
MPAKFKKALRSFIFTCPRVKEAEGVNARTQWLDVLKSVPNNAISKALVVLEPHMPDEGLLDEWAENTEEAKPPNHIHAFVWDDEPTETPTADAHVCANGPIPHVPQIQSRGLLRAPTTKAAQKPGEKRPNPGGVFGSPP